MDDFGQDYFQYEMGRAITDLQNAKAALMRAKSAATVDDEECRRAWASVCSHNRSAIWLASSLSIAEAVGYLPSINPELVRHEESGAKPQ
jgi:hypothetical protein